MVPSVGLLFITTFYRDDIAASMPYLQWRGSSSIIFGLGVTGKSSHRRGGTKSVVNLGKQIVHGEIWGSEGFGVGLAEGIL